MFTVQCCGAMVMGEGDDGGEEYGEDMDTDPASVRVGNDGVVVVLVIYARVTVEGYTQEERLWKQEIYGVGYILCSCRAAVPSIYGRPTHNTT